ncbi:hypothetical protein ACJRO7_032975 [Eucalyptus globulus]|uniref:Uncharacterized protein n=1 Tax=Eucalyptus globulus TaxID=34317 RepID=A0ABD3JPU5_EUCGL
MASDEEEERVLEVQLELQLQEQRDSLSSLKEALASDPANAEILAVHEELVSAIRDVEEGLFHLKRARLLREVDSVVQKSDSAVEDVKVESLDPNDVEAEPLEEQRYSIGSKCRFCHSDGHWYNGQIVGLEGSQLAKISFLTPTTENMLFMSLFKSFIEILIVKLVYGEKLSLNHGMMNVVLDKFGVDCIALSEYAEIGDEEESDLSSEQSDSSDYEEEDPQGLGFLEITANQRGVQTETSIFAKWGASTSSNSFPKAPNIHADVVPEILIVSTLHFL